MPYAFRKLGNGRVAVVKKDTGKIIGRHPSKERAEKQVAAIYANEARNGSK